MVFGERLYESGSVSMPHRLLNADKPRLWKGDIAASVDQFNEWFMRFAPEAF